MCSSLSVGISSAPDITGNNELPSGAEMIEYQHMMRNLATRFKQRHRADSAVGISGALRDSSNSSWISSSALTFASTPSGSPSMLILK
jgi:hypothetical protein